MTGDWMSRCVCLCVRACVCDCIPRYNVVVCVCAYMYSIYTVQSCMCVICFWRDWMPRCVCICEWRQLEYSNYYHSYIAQCHYIILAHVRGGKWGLL